MIPILLFACAFLAVEAADDTAAIATAPIEACDAERVFWGDLKFQGDDIETGLRALTAEFDAVGGDLYVLQSTATNLEGARGLRCVGGRLYLGSNSELESLSGLDDLEYVGEGVDVSSNPKLVDLAGLGALHTIGGALNLDDNVAMTSTRGLDNLAAVEKIELTALPALVDIDGFESLESIGTVRFQVLPFLGDLSGLASLRSADTFVLSNIRILPSLSGLVALETVGDFSLDDVPGLVQLGALPALRTIDTLSVSNGGLRTLAGLEGVAEIGYMKLHYLPEFLSVDGLSGLHSVRDLSFHSVPKLHSLTGLATASGLEHVYVRYADSLTSLDGLPAVNPEVEFTLYMVDCRAFSDLSALAGVRRFDSLHLQKIGQLTSLAGLESAESAAKVSFTANPLLVSLGGLDALAAVGIDPAHAGYVLIEDNPLISSLIGWNTLREVAGSLSVSGNASLPQADVETWAANIDVGGSITLDGNAP